MVHPNITPPDPEKLAADAKRYQAAQPLLNRMRKAFLNYRITADEYKKLRTMAIAGYVPEASKQFGTLVENYYKGVY